MSFKTNWLDRRAVLRGLGAVTVGLPFLEGMIRPGRTWAAAATPKRFIVFNQNNGAVRKEWLPTGGETTFQLSRILKPLEPYRRSLVMIDGVDNLAGKFGNGTPHMKAFGGMLTGAHLAPSGNFSTDGQVVAKGVGWPENISIDQKIAKHIGTTTRFPSFEFGVQCERRAHPVFRISYRQMNQPLPPENDPRSAFARIFTGGASAATDPKALEGVTRRMNRRQSVLDYVSSDLDRLKARIGGEDRKRVDLHLDSIREVEKRMASDLAGLQAPVCQSVSAGEARPQGFTCSEAEQVKKQGNCTDAHFGVVGRAHIDVMALALRCDATRVASLQWGNSAPRITFDKTLGQSVSHHDLDHAGALEPRAKICTWYSEQFGYLLKKLSETKEADGSTLLDSSLVLWVFELGDGAAHSSLNPPWVLAGDAGGALRTGRFLSFPTGRAHNDVLVSCMNAFGIQEGKFGRDEYNKGPLPGLV